MRTRLQVPPIAQPLVGAAAMTQTWYRFFQDLVHLLGFRRGTFVLPTMTTAERDTLAPENGMMVYNSDDDEIQGYYGGAWVAL